MANTASPLTKVVHRESSEPTKKAAASASAGIVQARPAPEHREAGHQEVAKGVPVATALAVRPRDRVATHEQTPALSGRVRPHVQWAIDHVHQVRQREIARVPLAVQAMIVGPVAP